MHWKELDVGRVWYSSSSTFIKVSQTRGLNISNPLYCKIDIPSMEPDAQMALKELGPLLIAGIM